MGPQMRLPSVMKQGHTFSKVPSVSIERSTFDRSHGYKTTFNSGYLVPFYVDEALPGDTFNCSVTALARLTTPLKPLMDNLYFETFFFAVPYRLVWTNFVKFMGEQEPLTFTVYNIPQFNAYSCANGSLSDYMGLPIAAAGLCGNISHSSLWHRAYNLIYNQWFRDENLINSATVDMGDGPDNIANYVLRRRGKRHDYFTSCLPWPQKAVTSVALPLTGNAPIRGISVATATDPTDGNPGGQLQTGGVPPTGWAGYYPLGTGATIRMSQATAGGPPVIEADLSAVTAATINELRQAFQVQRYLERDARGGTRYTEKVLAHFRVKSPDARLQRAEYLGGGSTPVVVNPVAQTAQTGLTGGSTPLANLGAIGTIHASGHGFSKSFTEHCLLLGIMNVRADLTYQTGMDRMWSRQTIYDLYWPEFAHLGEQTVLNKEILYEGSLNPTVDAQVFGYQERYAEYRYKNSLITGQFRSYATTPLDIWHLSQKFLAVPTLGQTFIEENPPVSRVIAVPTEPEFYLDAYIRLICARPMPVFGVPGLIDHF